MKGQVLFLLDLGLSVHLVKYECIFITQICFADSAYSHHPCHSVCMCLRVCVCVTFLVNLCCNVSKILTKSTIWTPIFPVEWRKSRSSSWTLPSFSRSKLCHFIILANILQMVWDRANITIAIRYEVRYLPSNGAIVNVVLRYLDLYLQGDKIYGNHILFNSEKCSDMTL